MRSRDFTQVDVFTAVPYKGNPVAVVLDGEGLSDAEMQAFANWTNLSETTFVLPATTPVADYRVRIFTPKVELPFAGHPTLGTAHAVMQAGIAQPKGGKLVQQCAVGLVDLTVGDSGLSFRLPRYALSELTDPEATAWIGAPVRGKAQAVDVGPVWLVAELESIADLEGLNHDAARLSAYYGPRAGPGRRSMPQRATGWSCAALRPVTGLPKIRSAAAAMARRRRSGWRRGRSALGIAMLPARAARLAAMAISRSGSRAMTSTLAASASPASPEA